MTPLIDVVFLLLVFFLLTTSFTKPTPSQDAAPIQEAIIDVQLARSASGDDAAETQMLTVFLDDKGLLYVDSETPLAPNQLKQTLLDEVAAGRQSTVNLKADKRASHGAVIEALDLIKEAGIESVNLIIEKASE